ncbi:MAG: hypothetical protein ACYSUC_06545 [Planctomycetota bacterium]|jgi:hypothetical protein
MNSENQSSQVLENLLFPKIFQTFRIAIQPSKLIIVFLALSIIFLAGRVMDFNKTVVGRGDGTTELQVYIANPDQLEDFVEGNKEFDNERRGVFSTLWQFARERFHGALYSLFAFDIPGVAKNIGGYFKAVVWAFRYHFIYCIIFGAIKLAIISVAGGAICRMAALQLAQGEKPGLTEALRFSTRKFLSFFTAPLLPIAIILFIGLFVFLLGLVGNIPRIGELIMGIFMPLALIAGSLIAILLIGAVAGFNLMFPAVAYEGSDCFDAMSRSFNYIYSRPWRMGFYTALAVVYGAICYVFVRFFAFLLLLVTHWLLQLGVWVESSNQVNKLAVIWSGPSFANLLGSAGLEPAKWSESFAAFLVYLFLLLVIGLVVSFVVSFYFSANTIIYSLMRNRVDNTSLEDIYTHPEDTQTDLGRAEPGPEESPSEPEPEPDLSSSTE